MVDAPGEFIPCEQQLLFELAIKLVTFMSCSNEKTILSIKDSNTKTFKFDINVSCQ
jgi:hypothetical protein